jgi:Major Facilitator Superfamily
MTTHGVPPTDATPPVGMSGNGDEPAGDGTENLNKFQRWKLRTGGGLSLMPLAVLFGLNAADELDRNAFGVLLPEIRDHFGLDTSGILTVVSLSLIAALLIALPIGFWSDRLPRLPIALTGAVGWAVFSVMTGLAPTLVWLGISRAGAGLGRAVNEPVHNSLLADYYDIPVRPRPVPGPVDRRPHGLLLGVAVAVPRVRRGHDDLRRHGPEAPGARAGLLGAQGDGRVAGRGRDGGGGAELG